MIPERKAQLTDRQLEWAARKAAGSALTPDDVLLDIEVGNLKRFRDNGVDKPIVTPKVWARAIPVARGIMTVTYTRQQVLFLSDGLAFNCPLVCVHRAELQGDDHQVFVFGRHDSPLAILELARASRRGSTQPRIFVDRLLATRDDERAMLPATTREQLEQQDRALRSRSIDELWGLPPAHIKLWNATSKANASDTRAALDSFEPEQTLNEARWQILCEAITAAHGGDAAATSTATMRLDTDVPAEGHAPIYVWYTLRYAVADYLGRKPTLEDLQEIARQRHPKFAQVIRGDADVLEDELRSAFSMPAEGRQVTGGMFAVLGIAALGVILEDPATQLAAIKPHLAEWWRRRGRDLVRDGVRSRGQADEASS